MYIMMMMIIKLCVHVFQDQPRACTASESADCILNHIRVVHISCGVEKELETAQPSRERCVYLSTESVWLRSGLMYGRFQRAWKKAFPNNSLGSYRISRLGFFRFNASLRENL